MECKYCAILPNGDIPDGDCYEELLDMDFTDGIEIETSYTNKDSCGYESQSGNIKIKASHDLNAHVCITEGNKLNLDVWDDVTVDPQFHTDIRIKYCPMCGRKLEAFQYE